MSKLVVGNWKLNPPTLNEAVALTSRVSLGVSAQNFERMVLLPPFIFLEELAARFKQIAWGAQDVFWEQKGAYTGEVSLPMLKSVGANWVLAGHSERRRIFGETDEDVNKKVLSALGEGFGVIAAVGELQRGDSSAEIAASFKRSLSGAERGDLSRLRIAYEPVWAISTNPNAEPDDPVRSSRVIGALKTAAFKMFGGESKKIKYLYGGSVDSKNARGFLLQENIGGLLVGGASLKADEFVRIVEIAGGFVKMRIDDRSENISWPARD